MVSIETIIAKARRDGIDIDEPTAIEWAAEALEFIGAVTQYEEAVAFVEVKDFRAAMPPGLTHVIQIARNRCFTAEESCPATILEEVAEENDTVDFVPLDCNGMPVAEYDLAYYRPYADLIWEYQGWQTSSFYNRCFEPVRLSHHTFFNTIVCTEQNEAIKSFYQTAPDSYTIQDPYFILSFQEGQIAVAYRRVKTDERGWPLIPDEVSYKEAITRYYRYKMAQRKYDEMMDNATLNYLSKAEQDYHWYVKMAGNKELMVKGIDGYQDLLDQKSYLIPRVHRYYGFFGRTNLPEDRHFNGVFWRRTATLPYI